MKIKSRNLGYFETFTALMHDHCYGGANIGTIINFSGKLDKNIIKEVLLSIQKKHPILRAGMYKKEDGQYQFKYDEEKHPVSLKVLDRDKCIPALSILEREVGIPYELKTCLWKCILLYGGTDTGSEHELILFAHHSVMDGMSTIQFIKDFMNFTAVLSDGKPINNLSSLPVLYSIEHYAGKEKITWSEYLEKQLELSQNPPLRNSDWHYINNTDIKNRIARIYNISLPSEKLSMLINNCRAKQVTVNNALNAAALIAFTAKYNKNHAELNLPTPVNMRMHSKPVIGPENMGNFVNWLPVFIKYKNDETFWDTAKKYRESFNKSLNTFGHNPEVCDPEYVLEKEVICFNYPEYSPPPNFCTVTNLEVVQLDKKYSHFILEKMNYAVAFTCGGTGIAIICHTFRDTLNFNICYTEPLFDEAWIKEFSENFITLLKGNV